MPKTTYKDAADVMKRVVADNNRFNDAHDHDFFETFMAGQSPYVTIVHCADSRSQIDAFAREPFNNVFEVANAGNRFRADKGSVSYGVKHLKKTPVLMVIGHTGCGAIKAAMGDYSGEDEDICAMLDGLHLAIRHDKQHLPEDQQVLLNVTENVNMQVRAALRTFGDEVKGKTLTVVGAVFDMHNQLGGGYGKLYVFNVNGETDVHELKLHRVFAKLPTDDQDTILLDLTTLG